MTRDPGSQDLYVGVDIGGTFTDLVVMDAHGSLAITKAMTTPGRLQDGVFAALRDHAATHDLTLEALLSSIRRFGHGTTQATNALIERTGARTALITTLGFGDTLTIQRLMGFTAGVPSESLGHYSRRRQPEPIVPRHLVGEVSERVDALGRVIAPLDERTVREAALALAAEHVEAVAVCLLWSFRNPAHEQRVREIVHEVRPDAFISVSSEVSPVIGEYERTATTVLNVYLAPVVAGYLEALEGALREHGFRGDFSVLNSSGGVVAAHDASTRPVQLLMSGPAGGVIGARHLATTLGHENVITTDMGGTSFDVGLIIGGRPLVSGVNEVGGYHLSVPMIQIRAIGAGGGSIARVVDGMLRVGPESAGAVPGPVCYGRGGDRVTVTDADVVLGIIDPEHFLAGRMRLDRDAAVSAMRMQIAEPLGLGVEEAAAGIRQLVDSQMADILREVTVGRGHDPRDFVIYAYGGAGPVHCSSYGRELGVARIIVPAAGVAQSAYGALTSDIVHTVERSVLLRGGGGAAAPWDGLEADAIAREYTALDARCRALLVGSGVDEDAMSFVRSADLRYRRQTHELIVPYEEGTDALRTLIERFETMYEDTYGAGAGFREAGIELTTLRVEGTGRTAKPGFARPCHGGSAPYIVDRMVFDVQAMSRRSVSVVAWAAFPPDLSLEGPAIVEHNATTIYVEGGQRAHMDGHGNLVIDVEGPR